MSGSNSGICRTFNMDMQGFATRLTTFVTQVCLGIIVKWSPPDIRLDKIADSFLFQSYSVILSTFLTIGRQQLSQGDVDFSVYLTFLSPMGLYFFVSNSRDLWRNWRRTFTGKEISKLPRRVLILLIPGLILLLQVIIGFPNSFRDSDCEITYQNSQTWIASNKVEQYTGQAALACWILVVLAYTILHWNDIFVEACRLATNKSRWTWLRRVKFALLFLPSWVIAHWRVITRSHPWVLVFLITFSYALWAFFIRPFGVEPGYVLSYGQILALFTATNPLLRAVHLIYDRRHDISDFLKRFPKTFVDGIIFFTTARRNPWKRASQEQEYIPVGMPCDTVGLASQTTAPKIETPSASETAAVASSCSDMSFTTTNVQNNELPPAHGRIATAPMSPIASETDPNRPPTVDTALPSSASTNNTFAPCPTSPFLTPPSDTRGMRSDLPL